MATSETELLALLRELDDSGRPEQPLHYDRAAAGLAFSGLVRRLEADFGAACESERDTQDSSEYGCDSSPGSIDLDSAAKRRLPDGRPA